MGETTTGRSSNAVKSRRPGRSPAKSWAIARPSTSCSGSATAAMISVWPMGCQKRASESSSR
ncbi:MAG: hypothetical protein ACREN5_13860 [Gemmatimonadales bacterium]